MPRHSYRERDYILGQATLMLRKSLRLTQAGLADLLGVSRRAVGEWEAYRACRSESSAQRAESFAALPRIT